MYEVKPNPPQLTLGGRSLLYHSLSAAKAEAASYAFGARVVNITTGKTVWTHYANVTNHEA